jgi:protein ImuB
LLFPAKRLLTQLAGYLASRCAGVQQFKLLLRHEDMAETFLEIGLSAPARDADRFTRLVQEKLAAAALDAPVTRVGIEASEILLLAGESADLFPHPARDPDDWNRLLERLRARLGAEAVQGLSPRSDHRPERAWQITLPGTEAKEIKRPPRPLWLLEEPRPLSMLESTPQYRNQPLALTAGPERIESGWWDDGDVKRDYFIAQTPDLAMVWIYQERRRPGGWYLHGIFG